MKVQELLPTRKNYRRICSYFSQKKKGATAKECVVQPAPSKLRLYAIWLLAVLVLILVQYNYYYSMLGNTDDGSHSTHKAREATTAQGCIINQLNETWTAVTVADNTGSFVQGLYTTKNHTLEKIDEPDIDLYRKNQHSLPICHVNMKHLGRRKVKYINRTLGWIDSMYEKVLHGGFYSPPGCRPRHKVAVLVTYRNREKNLGIFLLNIHPLLMKQKLEYRIFVIEQADSYDFNMGRLYNAGFLESQRFSTPGDCVIFHDIDLIPMDDRILYTCPIMPRHMAASILRTSYNPSFRSIFGGVTAMTRDQFQKVNGYSNWYWGWGGEDHDLFWRLRAAGYMVTRYNKSLAIYANIAHRSNTRRHPNPIRYELLHSARKRSHDEGLSTLNYRTLNVMRHHLYTRIQVDVNPDREDPKEIRKYLKNYL